MCAGLHLGRWALCDTVGRLLHRVCCVCAAWTAVVLCVEESICEPAETGSQSLEVPAGKQGNGGIVRL